MAETYGFNVTDLSDLLQGQYSQAAILGFQQTAVWQAALAAEYVKTLERTNSITFTKPGGFTMATSAYTPGAALAYTTPTETQVAAAWSTYYKAVQIDQTSQQSSVIELVNMSLTKWVRTARENYEYLAAVAAGAGTDTDQIDYVGQDARAELESTDILTQAYIKKGVARLRKNGAPPFTIPGLPGPVYIGFIHPDVAYDLKGESTGIFEGSLNVNGSNYQLQALGVHCGVLWFETPSGNATTSGLIVADGGSSNVDAYKTIIVADESFGFVDCPVAAALNVLDIALNPTRSMVGRITNPGNNLGIIKEVGFIANIGFKIIEEGGIYRIESASSLGDNT